MAEAERDRNLSFLPEPAPVESRDRGRDVTARLTLRALRYALAPDADPRAAAVVLARLAGTDRLALLRAMRRIDGEDGAVDAVARELLERALHHIDEHAALTDRRPA
jgi:hypothetical protein